VCRVAWDESATAARQDVILLKIDAEGVEDKVRCTRLGPG
jgi:hypothetical protein